MKLTSDEERAILTEVLRSNPDSTAHKISNTYPNFLGGTLIAVDMLMPDSAKATNHVLLVGKNPTVYRTFHDVCEVVSMHRETRWFFRLLELAGVGGTISIFLILIFSVLLAFIALFGIKTDQTVVEIIKLSFTTVLGFFLGNQALKK